MFPKAHATAYVMMAWRIAWFKLYYPLAYYSTYFTTRPDVFDLKTILKGKEEIQIKLSDLQKRKYLSFGEKQLSAKESALIPIFEICLEALSRGVKISNVHLKKSKAIN
jgi:DNA polymerase-3 subunit alpha (Gram-positive type)